MDVPSGGIRHLERIDWAPDRRRPPDLGAWPYTIPAVAQLIDEGGIDVAAGVTLLIGENGSGKSTLVEAFASVYPRRGAATPFADVLGPSGGDDESPLAAHLRPTTNRMASPAGVLPSSQGDDSVPRGGGRRSATGKGMGRGADGGALAR